MRPVRGWINRKRRGRRIGQEQLGIATYGRVGEGRWTGVSDDRPGLQPAHDGSWSWTGRGARLPNGCGRAHRFAKSKGVGAAFGLTPTQYQSEETDRKGRISKRGDEATRVLRYEAAQVMLTRTTKWNWLKVWAMQIAKRSGFKRAVVALARRLAVVLHRMWVDGTDFRWAREPVNAS